MFKKTVNPDMDELVSTINRLAADSERERTRDENRQRLQTIYEIAFTLTGLWQQFADIATRENDLSKKDTKRVKKTLAQLPGYLLALHAAAETTLSEMEEK